MNKNGILWLGALLILLVWVFWGPDDGQNQPYTVTPTGIPSSSQVPPAISVGCTVLEEGVTIVPLRQGIKSGCYSLKRGTHLSYTFASRGCIEVYPNSRPAVRDCNKDVIKLSDGSEYLTRIAFKAEEATEVLVTITRK